MERGVLAARNFSPALLGSLERPKNVQFSCQAAGIDVQYFEKYVQII